MIGIGRSILKIFFLDFILSLNTLSNGDIKFVCVIIIIMAMLIIIREINRVALRVTEKFKLFCDESCCHVSSSRFFSSFIKCLLVSRIT